MSPDVEDYISAVRVMRLYLPGSVQQRWVLSYLEEGFLDRLQAAEEGGRLIHRADNGDAEAQALVAAVAPAWEMGREYFDSEDVCRTCGRSAHSKVREAKPGSDEPASPIFTPRAKPGSATAIAWGALAELSPQGEPVSAEAWRDAALVAMARAAAISDPVSAFRDAKRNLKGQKAFTEASNGDIQRKV